MNKPTPFIPTPGKLWADERVWKQTPSFKPLAAHPREKWRAMESHLYSLRFRTEAEQSAAVQVQPEDLARLRAVCGTVDATTEPRHE